MFAIKTCRTVTVSYLVLKSVPAQTPIPGKVSRQARSSWTRSLLLRRAKREKANRYGMRQMIGIQMPHHPSLAGLDRQKRNQLAQRWIIDVHLTVQFLSQSLIQRCVLTIHQPGTARTRRGTTTIARRRTAGATRARAGTATGAATATGGQQEQEITTVTYWECNLLGCSLRFGFAAVRQQL